MFSNRRYTQTPHQFNADEAEVDVRGVMRGQEPSFTEIAKTVGERWQVLSQSEREGFERQAAAAREEHHAELSEYKKTPQYTRYQEYLADFKAKHATAQRGTRIIRFCASFIANS